MTTLREWLNNAKVNWQNLVIVVQTRDDNSFLPVWGKNSKSLKLDFRENKLQNSDFAKNLLDFEFDCGFGAPEAPKFIGDDGEFLYFPEQYDGATNLVKVAKNIDYYTDCEKDTPYPGG